MTLTPLQTLGIILAVAAGTQLTRWLPFWLFPEKREPPAVVTYLGRVLPPAMMGLLVVYCLKYVTTAFADTGLWQVIAALATGICYKCSHNTFVSIVLGTACYMLLLRLQI